MVNECGCCSACLAELPDHWISDLWRYCPHRQTMSRRRSTADRWTIDHDVKPQKAMAHLEAAVAKMRAHAKRQGMSLEEADGLLRWYRDRGRPQG